jgi:hypothetical protein
VSRVKNEGLQRLCLGIPYHPCRHTTGHRRALPRESKLSTIESTLTLLGDVIAAETLESGFLLVGLQPPKRVRCAHGC